MEMQKFIGGIPMHLNYQTIGKRIRLLRKQQQLSQMTLAEMVDKSPTYISLVENGQKGPSLETLIDVANALKVTMDVLLAEYLEQNTAAAGVELSAIIEDCSEYEKRVKMCIRDRGRRWRLPCPPGQTAAV